MKNTSTFIGTKPLDELIKEEEERISRQIKRLLVKLNKDQYYVPNADDIRLMSLHPSDEFKYEIPDSIKQGCRNRQTKDKVQSDADWDNFFMNLAESVGPKSKDPNRKVGAVIVGKHKQVLSVGFNGLARGVVDDPGIVPTRYERPEKYLWIEHAERNAIYNAARHGISLDDSVLYVTMPPCTDCARGIIQTGITKVVSLDAVARHMDTRWKEQWLRSVIMFDEAGVEVLFI